MFNGNGKRIALITAGVLVFVTSYMVVRTLVGFSYFKTLTPEFAGTCTAVTSPPGPEDLVIDRRTGVMYLSSFDRRLHFANPKDDTLRGGIFALDIINPENGFVDMTVVADAEGETSALTKFRPHGLSLFVGDDGRTTLMAISHPSSGHTVEIFGVFEEEVEGRTVRQLVHRETIENQDAFVSPNDIHAVDHDRFYVTNDHGSTSGFSRFMEDLRKKDNASVAYYDGTNARIAAEDLTYANGINVIDDGRTLVVAETVDNTVRFYDRDPATGGLTLKDLVYVGNGVDNIDVAVDGSLWIASHPKTLMFMGHARDKKKLSPSQVLRIVPESDGSGGVVEQIYLNLGEEISGSSVAVTYNQRMFVGQVFDERILICDLP